jgi:hypothetical protein
MYGLLLIIISILLENILLFAIGMGLFIDELTYLIIRGKSHEDNYSKISLLGTLIFIILIFLFKNFLINLLI